jgi:hypothetical protein
MLTTIAVHIYNWNCLNNNANMVLDVDPDSQMLVINEFSSTAPGQIWTLIPNLVSNAHQAGGFTIYNQKFNGSADMPAIETQIPLGNDPDPYNAFSYCWTIWDNGMSGSTQLWAIQNAARVGAFDVYEQGTSAGTPVMYWNANNGANQQWVIVPAQTT